MSGNEDEHLEMKDGLAFEYVSGTLPADQRKVVEANLLENEALQNEVRFWEGQLMSIQNTNNNLPPIDSTWGDIESRINGSQSKAEILQTSGNNFWSLPFWKLSTSTFAFGWVLTLAVMFTQQGNLGLPKAVNANYVAVLTDESGAAKLTAHASQDGKKLWLKWDYKVANSEQSVQLWAQSRRDGQIRSLFVFESTNLANDSRTMDLNEANMRLIRDADFLILTKEDAGGSPIDEPSDALIAKGICVRLEDKGIIES